MCFEKLLLAAAAIGLSCSAQAASYTLVDLGPQFQPAGINALGQVVGTTEYSGSVGFYYQAGVWQTGVTTNLPTPAGFIGTRAAGINASGQIVGEIDPDVTTSHAAFYSNGAWTDLNSVVPGGATWRGVAVNALGQAAGTTNSTTGSFIYANPTAGVLQPSVFIARALNDDAIIAGKTGSVTGRTPLNFQAAYLSNGVLTTLTPTLRGSSVFEQGSELEAVSPDGTFVGDEFGKLSAGGLAGKTNMVGFLYKDGAYTLLGPDVKHTIGVPRAINASRQVVGVMVNYDLGWLQNESAVGNGIASLYSDGALIDLNNEIAPGSGWTLRDAMAINDGGSIVGVGAISGSDIPHGFLLTPIPEPGTLAVLALAIPVLSARSKTRRARPRQS